MIKYGPSFNLNFWEIWVIVEGWKGYPKIVFNGDMKAGVCSSGDATTVCIS